MNTKTILLNKSSTKIQCVPSNWKDMIVIDSRYFNHRDIKISDCPKCGSNLPLRKTDDKGICTCLYCGKDVYVW